MDSSDVGSGGGAGAGAAEGSNDTVHIKFTTKVARYRVPDAAVAVPVRFTRKGLSEVINLLLATKSAPIPFDFLINGTFLRHSLRKYMRKNGLSGESVITVEYVPALEAPDTESELKHPDWVSWVAAHRGGFVTACYDGALRAYSADGASVGTVSAHKKPIRGAAAVTLRDGTCVVASASKDGTVKQWRLEFADGEGADADAGAVWTQTAQCLGHTGSVESVAYAPGGGRLCSGGWDGVVCMWNAPATDGDESKDDAGDRPTKRARTAGGASTTVETMAPRVVLKNHAGPVTSVQWPSPGTIVSGSQDHSIRLWDLTSGTLVESTAMHGNKVINCVSTGADGVTFATAHPDHLVRLWDSRAAAASVVKLALRSHTEWVSSVEWMPGSTEKLLSCSYDGSVKLWDIRSSTPLHSLTAHEGKVLTVAWQRSGGAPRFVTGGSDKKVRLFRMPTETSA